MKKTIKPGVPEEFEIVCDVTGRPAVARLVLDFDYYGGVHDCKLLRVDLCEEVAADVLKLLQAKYPQFKTVEGDPMTSCPMCSKIGP